MKYLEEINGELYVSENIAISSDKMMIVSYKANKEELIELQKMKHFSMAEALKFWDNFNIELYIRILKAKNNE